MLHPAIIIGKGFMAVHDLLPDWAAANNLQKPLAVDVRISAAVWPPDGFSRPSRIGEVQEICYAVALACGHGEFSQIVHYWM